MDIGSKIKDARVHAKLTQEAAAEYLGVSRQTISNWENAKTYPDILSVIKMSDLYVISLDHLLKEERTMTNSNYLRYLEESTNTVKSRNKWSKLIMILAYLVIWGGGLTAFWVFQAASDAMGFSLAFLWILLPVTTLVLSILIGARHYWRNRKWFAALGFGIMYMLAEYASFSVANMTTFNKFNLPNWGMILVGAIVSIVGIGIGHMMYLRNKNKSTVQVDS